MPVIDYYLFIILSSPLTVVIVFVVYPLICTYLRMCRMCKIFILDDSCDCAIQSEFKRCLYMSWYFGHFWCALQPV